MRREGPRRCTHCGYSAVDSKGVVREEDVWSTVCRMAFGGSGSVGFQNILLALVLVVLVCFFYRFFCWGSRTRVLWPFMLDS
jgi:hypothetical protein